VQSRFDDPMQKIMFVEGHWVRAGGGRGVGEHTDSNVYLAISLRNVGAGIAVCQGWTVLPGLQSSRISPMHQPESEFRMQTRDLYIPGGDIGIWQGALRDRDDPICPAEAEAAEAEAAQAKAESARTEAEAARADAEAAAESEAAQPNGRAVAPREQARD